MKNAGSLLHQMINSPGLMERSPEMMVSFQTQKDYRSKLGYAATYFRKNGIRSVEEIDIPQIQEYADYLVFEGKSPSTVHNYLAPLCKVAYVPMSRIKKPRRVTSEYTRSRTKKDRFDGIPLNELPPPVLLSKCTGLRRSELKRVKGKDYVVENGISYVIAEKGKGGKRQMQRILPHYVPYVEKLFRDVPPEQKVLKDFIDNYDYHLVRRKLAQESYDYYATRCATGDEARKELYREIANYWHKNNKRDRDKLEPYSYFEKEYRLRGKTKAVAITQGKPVVLDRLYVRAVSVFHLAHWRDSVTIQSYYLD